MPNDLPVLGSLLPELTPGTAEFAIATAVLAYATGDAFGVAYEFEPLVSKPVPKSMLGKDDWPAGGVSDDTLLSLITISCLDAADSAQAADDFKQKLKIAAPHLRGLGPTTRHALGMHVEEREVGIIGVTNGGMMRTALLSLGFDENNSEVRQDWCRALCAATHEKSEALIAALLMAEIFASALANSEWNINDALAGARQIVGDSVDEINLQLDGAIDFKTDPAGVSLNPIETLLAVASIVRRSKTVWDAYENSICAGGDTDTLAALSGSLMALKNPMSFYELDFITEVNWQEIPEIKNAIELLIENRVKK
jgi:ADP-ribosylglycohydrolase